MPGENSTEKGYKWWVQHVIVPIVGGGGIVAIVVAIIEVWGPTDDKEPPPDDGSCPVIEHISATPRIIPVGTTATLAVTAHDPGGGVLTYLWEAERGVVDPDGETDRQTIDYLAPDVAGDDTVRVTVKNPYCSKTDSIGVSIVTEDP